MSIKTVRVLLGMLVAGALVLAGCENPAAGGFDDLPTIAEAEVGDELEGGWTVTAIDAAGGKIATRTADFNGVSEDQVLLWGTHHADVNLTNDKTYLLVGAVFIGNNAQNPAEATGNTITIQEGTIVRGETSSTSPGVLIITRGSKIDAQGTPTDPIVFTSFKEPGSRSAGDWGGIIINGYARVQGGYAEGEGGTGEYGGGLTPVDDDDSGILSYVRAEFAGALFTADNELNTFVMQGVGSGTTLEYIQAHRGADDGIEFFGGDVQLKYYVGTGILDDSLDGDDGWRGSAQFVILQSYSDDAGSIVEADGDALDDFAASNAILANITAIAGSEASAGFDFKSDANYDVYNSVLDMQAAETDPDPADWPAPYADKGGATINYFGTLVVGGTPGTDSDNDDLETASNGNELRASGSGIEGAVATLSGVAPNRVWSTGFAVTPTAGTFAAATLPLADPAGNALTPTTYIGAYDGSNQWWDGWIETPEN